jgi:hypothetical protein
MTDDELKRLFDTMRQDNHAVRQENAAAHAETRRHFEVSAERLEKRFDTLAESVIAINEKVERRIGAVEAAIERTATDTQAMIKFSHAELDRRMRSLEEIQRSLEDAVIDLQARVERLESSTH